MKRPRKTGHKTGRLRLFGSYMFHDKEPAIDELRTLIVDATGDRRLKHATLAMIDREGGPSASCMHGWFHGDTKRPQNANIEAAGRALGFHREWVKTKTEK